MDFNVLLEYLEQGKVAFLYTLSMRDRSILIKMIRSNERKNEIIKGFLSKLMLTKPLFCFRVIFDNDEFFEEAKYLLEKYYTIETFTIKEFEEFLNSKLAPKFVKENFDSIIEKFKKNLDFLFGCLFKNKDEMMDILKSLANHSNLHIRYLFMKYMLLNHPDDVSLFYSDITSYLSSDRLQENGQLITEFMDMKEACDLAITAFDKMSKEDWVRFKEFILNNYEYNDLASRLLNFQRLYLFSDLNGAAQNETGVLEFAKNADKLFETSSNTRLHILENYSSLVSREILERYQERVKFFYKKNKLPFAYRLLECYGLSHKLDEYVEKYMDLSFDKSYEYLAKGSTSTCYRIGDFVFKLLANKWSFEDVICPDLYLILSNLEEILVRDDKGVVCAGIEIQKFLRRSANDAPEGIEKKFKEELARLGYYINETLLNGMMGDNCKVLDDYLDSGNPNPPGWFKDYPMVLVDRDRVYKLENKRPKQQFSGRY